MKFTEQAERAENWEASMSFHLKKLNSLERKELFQKRAFLLLGIILPCSIAFFMILGNGPTGDFEMVRGKEGKNFMNQSPKVNQKKGVAIDVRFNEFVHETKDINRDAFIKPARKEAINKPQTSEKIQSPKLQKGTTATEQKSVTFELTPKR